MGRIGTRHIKDIIQKELKEAVYYDGETGLFTLLIGSHNRKVGEPAESIKGNYRQLSIPGMGGAGSGQYKSHRAVCLYMTGEWPEGDIDHIDGNGLNNRFENLRVVSRSVNCQNQTKRKTNKSGISGVSWCNAYKTGNRWRVGIARQEREGFPTLLDAVAEREIQGNARNWRLHRTTWNRVKKQSHTGRQVYATTQSEALKQKAAIILGIKQEKK